MPVVWWGLVGLFAAALVNRAADCWLAPARLACGATRHPARQAAVWLGLPALFVLLAARSAEPAALWPTCLFAAVLVLIAVIDWEQRRVPNVLVLPSTTVALAYAWRAGEFASALAGAGLAVALFLTLYALGRRLYGPGALGIGDVKLAGLIGAMSGLALMPYALLLGMGLAGGAAAVLLLTGRARRGDTLPYGHFMAVAALVVLVGGAWV